MINLLDIETFNLHNKIIIFHISLYYNKTFYTFYYLETKNIIINLFNCLITISKNKKFIEIYVHNINFDGILILDKIKKLNIKYDFFIRDNNFYWIKIAYCNKIIKIRCSYKILNLSINDIGKLLNMPKYIFPYKFVNINNLNYIGDIPDKKYFNNDEDYNLFIKHKEKKIFDLQKEIKKYCERDILILYHFFEKIQKIIYGYNKKILGSTHSNSSLAFKIFKLFFWKYDSKLLYLTCNILNNYIRESYYGGRCEVFGNPYKEEIIHYFDFKGMYAQCMLESFPIDKPIFKNTNLNINEIGFHTIEFESNDNIPILPYKDKKLYFLNGKIIGTYWFEEIKYAVEHSNCKIIKHISSVIFKKKDYIFSEFIKVFTKLRNKNKYYDIFAKNIINSLYGSFALNEEKKLNFICYNKEELNYYINHYNVDKIKEIGFYYILSVINEKKNLKSDKKRNVAYASIISSKARIKLAKAIKEVYKNNGRIYYTDTDSIFAGFKENKLNETMGEIIWSEIIEDMVCISPKFYYILNKKVKLKGINNINNSFEDIKKKFYNNEEILNLDNQFNIYNKNMELFSFNDFNKKIFLNKYEKRIFSNDKKTTIPKKIEDI